MTVIRYLILIVTTRCNLLCRYCYNGEVCNARDMSEDVVNRTLDIASQGEGPIHIQITGGEPTLVPDKIAMVLENVRRRITRPYTIGIQTNGTFLNLDLAREFKKYGVQVGISLDGPPGVNERLRGGTGATLRGLGILESCEVPFRITTVVTNQNVQFLDKLVYMLAGFKEIRGIGLDLLVRKGRVFSNSNDNAAVSLPTSDELRHSIRSLLSALDEINRRRSVPIVLREREKLEKAFSIKRRGFFCHASKGESMAVRPDGSIFPCGQTAGDLRFFAGDVWTWDKTKLGSLSLFELAEDRCSNCPIREFCPGDCPSRVAYNQDDAILMCDIYRTIWEMIQKS